MAAVDVTFSHRLVHLDLKGAPPKVEYIGKILPFVKNWGATGLLIEYEDAFPYSEELSVIHSQDAYSKEDIVTLQQLAAENNLIIIPLIQTFGHMEFVLKHKQFKHVREVANFPMALCPSNPDSLQLVCSMVDQVMSAHSNLQWFHIGCDEVFTSISTCDKFFQTCPLFSSFLYSHHILLHNAVGLDHVSSFPKEVVCILSGDHLWVYHLGICEKCRKRQIDENLTLEQLFFQHVKSVAQHMRDKYPFVKPIVWDDMFRFSDISALRESGLGELVEPMVWHYLTSFQLPADLWEKLAAVFPNIWIASAFKGATGSRACVSSVAYYLENQLTWLSTLGAEQHRFSGIRGFAVTGWQRYDHFAVLCELLPQALPCLGICLQTLEKGSYTADLQRNVSSDLGFSMLLPLNPFTCSEIPHCKFPGSGIYQLMIEYAFLEAHCDKFINSDGCLTWMNEYNVKRNFTNPVHLEPIFTAASAKLQQLEEIKVRLSAALSDIFFSSTVDEWLGTHLQPLIDRIYRCQQTAGQQLAGSLVEKKMIADHS